MKISHLDLAACINSPRTWLASRASNGPRKIGYSQLLKYALHQYNKSLSPSAALKYLNDKIKEHQLKNEQRADQARDTLSSYMNWCSHSKTHIADSRVSISLQVGGYLELTGIVSRIDIIPNGYRGILLSTIKNNWKEELRMPLLQKALSDLYQRPLGEIEIGMQNLDGSLLTSVNYSLKEVSEAQKSLFKLGERVKSVQ